MGSKLVSNKIDELIELSKMEDELVITSIFYAIRGAICMGAEGMLSNHISDFLRSTLMPMAQQGNANQVASKN